MILPINKMWPGILRLIKRPDHPDQDTIDMIHLTQEFDAHSVTLRFEGRKGTDGEMGERVVTRLFSVAHAGSGRILECTNKGRLEAKFNGIKFVRDRLTDMTLRSENN